MKRQLPSKEVLDQVLKYDPDTGELFWRPRPVSMFTTGKTPKEGSHIAEARSALWACNQWNSRWAGKQASTLKPDGYYYTHFNYRTELAHRLIYKIMTGTDPIEIDHIDGVRSNNRWQNLRNVTRSENFRNMKLKRTNKSGAHGVHFSLRQQKWIATLTIGTYDSVEAAIAARKDAEEKYRFHPNHGRH